MSRRDRPGRPTVFELVPDLPGLTYVGRLDVMTSGLLLFTTDGEALHRLTHPRYRVPRSYVVWGHGRTTRSVRAALNAGVRIEGRPVAIAEFRAVDLKGDRVRLELTLTEGRYRIVRRLCAQIGLTVDRLQRRSHGSVHLGRLPEGQWRWLTDREVSGLVGASAGLHQA